ncbi:MAG: dipeptidase PepE [Chitinophagaceae bacterium]|nr:dipeptidase PepE [Chitinophagaceae bacterium]
MASHRILALSSSRTGNESYLKTAAEQIKNFLGEDPLKIAFIPFALVNKNYDEYANNVRLALDDLQHTINLADNEEAKNIIAQSDVIMVGGGNTFKLLHDIYEAGLIDIIRNKINDGARYIGWSAGSNILSPTIGTTNDMPVIQPQSFNALGLFPFQINPHYINQKPEGHNGETRDQRLLEFMQINPGLPVVGLPEGTALQLEGKVLKFIGGIPGVLFSAQNNEEAHINQIMPGDDLSFLL